MNRRITVRQKKVVRKKSAKSDIQRQSKNQAKGMNKGVSPASLPVRWQLKELVEVATFFNGKAYSQNELLSKGKYKVLRVGNFFTNGDWYYSDLELGEDKYVNDGDLMYAWSASFGPRYWRGEKTIYHYHIWKVVPSNLITKEYLYFHLNYDTSRILNNKQGGTMFHITKGDIEKRKILLPPLLEQQKIARILSTWDKAIEKTEQLIVQKQKLKKGLMQQLLTGKMRFKEFEKSSSKPIRKWELKRLSDITKEMKSGLSRKLSSDDIGLPVLRSNNLIDNKIDYSDIKYWYNKDPQGADTQNYYLEEGDILINFINSLAQIGKSAIYKNGIGRPVIYTTNILALKLDHKVIDPTYFLNFTLTKRYKDYVQEITKPAVNQASFTTVDFKNLSLPIPFLSEQRKIVLLLNSLDKKIFYLTATLNKFKTQKKGLMQKLLTGQLRVKT